MTCVFLSHSSRDKDLARRIAVDLRSTGVQVWLDEWEIRVGESISQKIQEGLEQADFVAVLLTRFSASSGWVEKEWQSKIGHEAATREVAILPLRADDCDIPALLRDKKYADFHADYASALGHLVAAVENLATGGRPEAPPDRRVRDCPDHGLTDNQQHLLTHLFVNESFLTIYRSGYEYDCVRTGPGGQYWGYEYTPHAIRITSNEDHPKTNPPGARLERLRWLDTFYELRDRELLQEDEKNVFTLTTVAKRLSFGIISWWQVNEPDRVPTPSVFG